MFVAPQRSGPICFFLYPVLLNPPTRVPGPCPRWGTRRSIGASLPAIRPRPGRLRIRLRHILPGLGPAVISCPHTVIHIARRIHPDQSRAAARSRCLRRSHSRRTSLGSSRRTGLGSRSSSRSRSWSSSRPRGRRRRPGRHRSRRGSRRIPGLNTLMPRACPALRRRRGVTPILADSRSPSRRSRRSRLRQPTRRGHCQQPRHHKFHRFRHRARFDLGKDATAQSYAGDPAVFLASA